MTRGSRIFAAATLTVMAVTVDAATPRKPAKPVASPAKALAQSCDAHKFETTIQLTGPDGQPKQSKVKMCGTVGQSDAEWVVTLKDAVKKTSDSPQMPQAAKEQIIAAVNAEIERLSMPALKLPPGSSIAGLGKPKSSTTPDTPLARDFGALPPLPTASEVPPPNLIGPGGMIAAKPHLTLRCALAGDEDRPGACDSIDRDTILVVKADDAYPRGVSVRFVRKGDSRAELDLPALRQGQTATMRLPAAVCSGVVRSKVEIQALSPNSPNGTPAGAIGEYDLRC